MDSKDTELTERTEAPGSAGSTFIEIEVFKKLMDLGERSDTTALKSTPLSQQVPVVLREN